jgi:hypothetical protein
MVEPCKIEPGDAALQQPVTVRDHDSIRAIAREAWERLLPGEPENYDFYAAVEGVPPPGFRLGAIAAYAGEAVVAVAPVFRVDYRLDTPFHGRLRRITDWLFAHVPRLVSMPVIGIGSPMSDSCALGFAPELTDAQCRRVFSAMLTHLGRLAAREKSAVLAVKSLDRSEEVLRPALAEGGYNRLTSVPLVELELPHATLDQYLASLPAKTGGYLKRKMRSVAQIEIEDPASIAGVEDRIVELFQNTLGQSKVDYGDFQSLDARYFVNVLQAAGDKAHFMICRKDKQVLSFQLSLAGRDRIVAKQIGMKYPEARDLNLYFINWLKLIGFAINRRIGSVEMGATTYATKLLFGGHLERRWLHFRFRGRLANALIGRVARFADFERNDPELKTLDEAAKQAMGPRISRIEEGRRYARRSAGNGHG